MRGGDTAGLRAYNERLIMAALRRAGALSRAEIARETGLSGQAASVIVSRLMDDGLVVKRPKVRGQVGQPSTPIAPNPSGAFSLGIKIGRRSIEAILVNLLGEVVDSREERYDAPFPTETLTIALSQANDMLAAMEHRARKRVVGIGVAIPGELEAWAVELGLPADALEGWRELDVAAMLSEATDLDTYLHNDATAACAAEMIAGDAITSRSALYFYLGTFIGGGIVIDGKLYRGEQLNAGAVGSMPTGDPISGGQPRQLIHAASVILLEQAMLKAGFQSIDALADEENVAVEQLFETWCEEAIPELSRAVVSALSVIDFQTVVVDGLLPPNLRRRVAERLQHGIAAFNRSGLSSVRVATGTIGPMARVLGAAMLPLEARFSPDTDLLVRATAARAADAYDI